MGYTYTKKSFVGYLTFKFRHPAFLLAKSDKGTCSKGQEEVTEVKLKCGPGLAEEACTADNVAGRTGNSNVWPWSI